MWKSLLLLIMVLPSFAALAQKKKKDKPIPTSFYLFDENWKSCKVSQAKYMILEDRLDDTVFQIRYYNYAGPLIKLETYSDYKKTIPNGYFAYYDESGKVDSCGYSWNGKKDQTWIYFNDSLQSIRTEEYEKGKLKEAKDEATLRAERKKQKEGLDPGVKEASFSGGDQKWKTYLMKNIQFPPRAMSIKKGGKVMVRFIVDTDGLPKEIWLDESVEYSIDEESVRLIKEAPAWEPATRDGKKVKAYRRQPITYRAP
jgi:TonB family protein